MTFSEFIELGRIRSKTVEYKRKKEKAISICAQQLEAHNSPYVALSGGKDSVAMSYLVNQAAEMTHKDFSLWLHYSDASFPQTLETCEKLAKNINRKLDVYKHHGSAFDLLASPQKRAFGKSGVFFESIREYAQTHDLAFVGVRAYESKRRMKAAKAHGMCFHSASMGNIDVVNPLQWFKLIDVAAVLYEYNAPIHPIYTKFDIDDNILNANKEPLFIRLGYITSRDLIDKGTVTFIKLNYPEIYSKLSEACPDITRFT